MDDSLLELENELKRLPPRQLSAQLIAAIEARLAGREPVPIVTQISPVSRQQFLASWLNGWTTAVVAAGLAFAAVLVTARRPVSVHPAPVASQPISAAIGPSPAEVSPAANLIVTTAEAPADRYRPVGAASVLYDLREDGASSPQNSAPVRRLRYRYVDTYTWKNPATHASLKWSVPRDEVRVLPVSLH